MTRSGAAGGGGLQRLGSGRRLDHVIAGGLRAGRRKRWICGSSSTTRMRSRLIASSDGVSFADAPETASEMRVPRRLHSRAFGAGSCRPWPRRIPWQWRGPSPVPVLAAVRLCRADRTFRRSRSSSFAGMPLPRSVTEITTSSPSLPGIDADRIAAAVFDRIVDQVEQHLAEQHAVASDQRQLGGEAGLDDPAREISRGPLARHCGRRRRHRPSRVWHRPCRPRSGHVEQVGDEARQALAFLLDRGQQIVAAFRRHLVAELRAGW